MTGKKLTPAQKFDEANKNFKTVYRDRKRQHHLKYRFLHNWTLKKSQYLMNDEKTYKGNKKVYRRGAIVNVDFGVNVGTELSGNHFAIVLTKDDSPKNEKLTVIPLSSHYHPHSISLKNTVKTSGSDYLFNKQLDFIALYAALLYFRQKLYKQMDEAKNEKVLTPHELLEKVKTTIFIKHMDDFQKVEEVIEKSLKNENTARSLIKTVSPEIAGNQDPLSTEFLENTAKAISEFTIVVEKYSKYNLATYAKVGDITTVSKARLMKINRYDPIGKILSDDATLNEIDSELKEMFTKKAKKIDTLQSGS